MPETCGGCRFYSPADREPYRGWCRRYPPKVVVVTGDISDYTRTEWPEVAGAEWCGEYEATPATGVCVCGHQLKDHASDGQGSECLVFGRDLESNVGVMTAGGVPLCQCNQYREAQR